MLEVRGKIGRFATCNGNTKAVRAFPEVTESTSTQYLAAAHLTGDHVTRLEHHRRGQAVLLGTVFDLQVGLQTYFDKVAGGVVNSAIALAAERGIQKATGSGHLH